MKKLLRKLFLYLFKEDFQRMKALERDLEGLIHRQKCATSLAEVRAERIRKLLGNIDVSVDVHHRSGSWAVVSNQGGIELGHVHPAMFQPKFIYVIACLQSYIGLNTLVAGQFCPYNDKKHPKRKPNPGMLEDMLAEFTHNTGITIAKEDCLMIGDASGLEGQFSDSDLKTAKNFGCDYLDVTEFTNMELPEPLFKVIRLSDGEVVKDKDGNPLQNLTESEATDKVVFLTESNPKPQEQFTYVPMLWEVPHEPEQAPQPKEKIIHMNPKKQ